ncbi:acireductone dioxygenase [Monosporozyma unispora]|nr:1,2-dihydroxy-3-keto-5-methylthiopentene dioxygenase [Kazachstania unispora]
MVRAYIHDNNNKEDFRLPHDSGVEVTLQHLQQLGVLYYHITRPENVDTLAQKRGYKNQDVVNISLATFQNDQNDLLQKLNVFYEEHLHEDEEIRYIVDGEGYFDIRDITSNDWLRCYVESGDLLIVPAGVYHRFTLTEKNFIIARRLFKDEPKWEAHNKSVQVDDSTTHKQYIENVEKSLVL